MALQRISFSLLGKRMGRRRPGYSPVSCAPNRQFLLNAGFFSSKVTLTLYYVEAALRTACIIAYLFPFCKNNNSRNAFLCNFSLLTEIHTFLTIRLCRMTMLHGALSSQRRQNIATCERIQYISILYRRNPPSFSMQRA